MWRSISQRPELQAVIRLAVQRVGTAAGRHGDQVQVVQGHSRKTTRWLQPHDVQVSKYCSDGIDVVTTSGAGFVDSASRKITTSGSTYSDALDYSSLIRVEESCCCGHCYSFC